MSQLTEDVLLLKSLNEGMLKFIGNKVAAFGIGAFLQSITFCFLSRSIMILIVKTRKC